MKHAELLKVQLGVETGCDGDRVGVKTNMRPAKLKHRWIAGFEDIGTPGELSAPIFVFGSGLRWAIFGCVSFFHDSHDDISAVGELA